MTVREKRIVSSFLCLSREGEDDVNFSELGSVLGETLFPRHI